MDACPICLAPGAQPFCKALLSPGAEREIYRCPQCAASYFWPIPRPDEIAKCYPHSYFRNFFRQYWKDYYKGRALARRILPWRKNGRFLDVGCALGTLLAGFRDASHWSVAGIEYMAGAVQAGKALNSVEIVNTGLLGVPWEDGSFDYIHANNVLEHEADPAGAVAKSARLLKPGGRLHLVLPNGPVDVRPNRDLSKKLGRAVHTKHSGHIFFYSRRGLELLLARAGLKLVSFRNFHFKTALKARGLTPGAYRGFLETEPAPPPETELTFEEYRRLIPKSLSWPLYNAQQRWRRLWRLPGMTWGYDFEVIAEK